MDVNDVFQVLGLGAPFAAAGMVYSLFKFLDGKASDDANNAITAWAKGENYKRLDLGGAILQAFDHLYGAPLLSVRSFLRSVIITIVAFLPYSFLMLGKPGGNMYAYLWFVLAAFLPLILVSDYASLFLVRKCLIIGKSNPRLALLAAFAVAVVTVAFVWVGAQYTSGFAIAAQFASPWSALKTVITEPDYVNTAFWYNLRTSVRFIVPAILVHLWLPLFFFSASINAGLSAFFQVAGFAQWFIKDGARHPFEAIGITASVVVFVMAVIFKAIHFFI